MTSSGGGEGSLQTRLRQGDSAGELQVDQAAEAAAFLGLVIGENIGEIMVEKRIHEPLEDRAAIGLRLLAEADPGEDRQHFAIVEIVKIGPDDRLREQGAYRDGFVLAARGPALRQPAMA